MHKKLYQLAKQDRLKDIDLPKEYMNGKEHYHFH